MAFDGIVGFDPGAAAGSKFPAEVKAEVQGLAPSTVEPGAVNTAALASKAVTTAKIADKAVGQGQLGDNAVGAGQLASAAVPTAALANGAVTGAKAGSGVLTIKDSSGSFVSITAVALTTAQYSALSSPNAATLYFIHA